MRLEHLLANTAQRTPDKTALVVGDQRTSYGDLEVQANRTAHALLGCNVRREDRVVIFHDNAMEAVSAIFGVLKAGAIFSMVNPATKAAKLSYILNKLRAGALITQDRLLPLVREAVAHAPLMERIFVTDAIDAPDVRGGVALSDETASAPASAPACPGIDLDLAYVAFTSGSTGFPKGVMMTHQSSVAGSIAMTGYLGNTSEDIVLSVIPLAFDYGLYQAIMVCQFGGTLVLERSFTFPYLVVRKLAQEKVTGFPLVPTIASMLLQMQDLKPGSLPHLRYITNTAAPLPPAHSARLRELFPSSQIFSNYGMTENIRATYLPPDQLTVRPTSVGKAIPNAEAYIVDEQGERVGAGVTGELVFRAPTLLKGYWEDPEATDVALRPGPYPWEKVLYTGDLFQIDEEGYLYFVGRKDDMIKCRGEKVSPKEVENALYALSSIHEAAVVGIPDPVLGTAIKAVVVLAEGTSLSEREIRAHCARQLEDYMVPKYIEFRGELPKTESGKIKRREL